MLIRTFTLCDLRAGWFSIYPHPHRVRSQAVAGDGGGCEKVRILSVNGKHPVDSAAVATAAASFADELLSLERKAVSAAACVRDHLIVIRCVTYTIMWPECAGWLATYLASFHKSVEKENISHESPDGGIFLHLHGYLKQ